MLRPYQQDLINAVTVATLEDGYRTILVQLPTGGGKTVIATELVAALGRRVLWLADRRELVEQAKTTLERAGYSVGVAMSGVWDGLDNDIVVALAQSVRTQPDKLRGDFDLIVIDEAHLGVAQSWLDILERFPRARIIGLTATPERSDGQALGDVFEKMVCGPSVLELVEGGYLLPVETYCPSPDEMDPQALAMDPVEAVSRYSFGRSTFIFARNREVSRHYVSQLNDAGITAVHVDGDVSYRKRTKSIDSFRAGRVQVLSSVDVVSRGFDAPIASVGILAARTTMNSVYQQKVGRIMRPYEGQSVATWVDLTDSTLLLGPPDAPRTYSLDGKPIQTNIPSLSTCKVCYAIFPAASRCPRCGEERRISKVATSLGKIKKRDLRRVTEWREMSAADRLRVYRNLKDQEKRKQYKAGYAAKVYRNMFGERPPIRADVNSRLRERLKEIG